MTRPRLDVAEARALPGLGDSPVQTWPDAQGRVRVAAYRVDAGYLIDWPGLARFTVTPGSESVTAVPDTGADHAAVVDAFSRFVVPLAFQAAGGEALHASAVCRRGAAVAFCAASGTGKSTVACGLVLRGFALLTDDGVLVDTTVAPPRVMAASGELRLRPESSAHFARPMAAGGTIAVGRLATIADARLAGLVVLDRTPEADRPAMQRLGGGEALAAVLAHAHLLDPTDPPRRARAVAGYLSVLTAVGVWRCRYPTGFDRLSATLDVIEQALGDVW